MRPSPGRYMYRPAGSCMHDPERGRTCAAPPVGACADWNSKRSGVQRRLFLRRWERPCGARAALLAKDEAQLLRRRELRLVWPEGGAGLGQLQCAQQVAPEIALIACDFADCPLALRPRH